MKYSFISYIRILSVIALLVVMGSSTLYASDELDGIHEDIKEKYDVEHIDNQALKALSAKKDVILFDVRESREFEVSHIEDAIRIDPDMNAKEFLELHADKLYNKVAVFYCSVGVRSSLMLEKLKDKLPVAGVSEAYNLEGGAFKWHNDQISLVSDGQLTRDIHPYNAYWGRLVDDKESITY